MRGEERLLVERSPRLAILKGPENGRIAKETGLVGKSSRAGRKKGCRQRRRASVQALHEGSAVRAALVYRPLIL